MNVNMTKEEILAIPREQFRRPKEYCNAMMVLALMEYHLSGKSLTVEHSEDGERVTVNQTGIGISKMKNDRIERGFQLIIELEDDSKPSASVDLDHADISLGTGNQVSIGGAYCWNRSFENKEAHNNMHEAAAKVVDRPMRTVTKEEMEMTCKIGKGLDTCIFLVVGENISCAKGSDIDPYLRDRARANARQGSGAARIGDCCEH